MKVSIIGSGNVATILGKKIKQSGSEIIQVWSRKEEHAKQLGETLSVPYTQSLQQISSDADIYIIAVSDTSIVRVASKLRLESKIVVHTAASVSKDVLHSVSRNYGVIYPLQTLRKETDILPVIPVLIDSNNDAALQAIKKFVSQWADMVNVGDDEQRLKLHISAVVTSNFTNYLFALAEQYCKSENLDFKILYPLIEETCVRLKEHNPSDMQTGPASRRDFETINRHLDYLLKYPQLQGVYKILSSSIMNKRS